MLHLPHVAELARIGNYEVLERLGGDEILAVYKAHDPILQRTVALKLCTLPDERLRARFFEQAEANARLDHPHIAAITDAGLHEGAPYLAEELLSGEPLARRIRRGGVALLEARLGWLAAVAAALAYAHGRGILHGELRSRCVHLLDEGGLKVRDFGIARLLSRARLRLGGEGEAALLEAATALAPEQLLGQEPDPASETFSFGVLAFEVLAASRPFAAGTAGELFARKIETDAPSLLATWPGAPPALADLVDRCLSRDPGRRPAGLAEVGATLSAIQAGLPAEPPAPPSWQAPTVGVSRADGGAGPDEPTLVVEPAPLPPANEPTPAATEERPPLHAPGAPHPDDVPAPAEPAVGEDPATTEAATPPAAAGAVAAPVAPAPSAPTPPPDAPLAPAPPRRPPRRSLRLAAGVGILALLALAVWIAGRRAAPAGRARPQPATEPAAPQFAAAPAGLLVVDAVPWGEVVRIAGPGGDAPVPADAYTPLALRLPAGEYEVFLRHPDALAPRSCRAPVATAGTARCVVEFAAVEGYDYFREAGWWR